jgi:hypothetical protein
MNQDDFVVTLEHDLRGRGVAFNRADLLAFVQAAWPLIEDDPDVSRWAAAFLECGRVTVEV